MRFTRNVANIVMDTNDVEAIDVNALGGVDTLTVNDLSGTDLIEVNADLAGAIGGTAGDLAADNVIVNGTNGDDVAIVAGNASGVSVLGLAAQVNVTGAEAGQRSADRQRPRRRRRHRRLRGGCRLDRRCRSTAATATTSSSAATATTTWSAAPATTC